MTQGRFLIARILAAIGIERKTKRLGDASAELHLLREAEEFLGYFCWRKCENVEEISSEYWNLRKLHQRRNQLIGQGEEKHRELAEASNARSEVASQNEIEIDPRVAERDDLIKETEMLAAKRDECVEKAKKLKRSYGGLKTKSEVLIEENGGNASKELDEIKERLKDMRLEFAALKNEREELAIQIEKNDDIIAELDDTIATTTSSKQQEATATFQNIGIANKDISKIRSEVGLLDKELGKYYALVGNHLSRFAATDPMCADATTDRGALVKQIRGLRQSLMMNNELIGER